MTPPSLPPTCPGCGAPIPENSPEGLCPRCLVKLPFATETDDHAENCRTPTPEEIAPYFPHLEIRRYLGRGGMGVVYKARQKSLNRSVALKLIAPERARDALFAARFEREAKLLATLNHPNVVTIHDFGKAGDYYYLLMEYVDGANLREALGDGSLTSPRRIEILRSLCDALHYAHARGIVHRDIKPENLLLDRSGRMKVADFGIAKLLDSETEDSPAMKPAHTAGTPRYMAPEQGAGHTADHRADIYAAGVILRELMAAPEPGDKLAPGLAATIRRATAEDREHRHPTAAALREDLENAVRRKSRKPWLLAAAALVLLAAAIGLAAVVSIRNAVTTVPRPVAPPERSLPIPSATPPIPPHTAADWLRIYDLGLNKARWEWSDEGFRRRVPLGAWASLQPRKIISRTPLPPRPANPEQPGVRHARRFLITYEGGTKWVETVTGYATPAGEWFASNISWTNPDDDAADHVVGHIMPLLDAGAYAEVRRRASETFRKNHPGREWERRIALAWAPLGERVFQSGRIAENGEAGVLSGERPRIVVETQSSFTRAASVTERFVIGCDDDGRWRLDDYFVVKSSPPREPPPGFTPPPDLIEEPGAVASGWLERHDSGAPDAGVTIPEATRRALAGATRVPGGRKSALCARSPLFTAPSHAYAYFTYTGAFAGPDAAVETVRLRQDDTGRWSVSGYEVGPEDA